MVSKKSDLALIAHLLRRAGFGATYEEMEWCASKEYEATVEELLHPEQQPDLELDFIMRLRPGWVYRASIQGNQEYWVYRMINTKRPLEEKMALFWHGIHCTGHAKVDYGRQMGETVEMFTRHGMGSFRELLIQLALDPGMVYYLDNNMSHKGAINENWGRELLELFSMGVGNYTEDDIKEASRAFTGWTNGPAIPPFPYGSRPWSSFYDATDHDDEEKEFLGDRGRFNGEDIVDIICCQPATARFVARHLYNFFVADEAPVPQWAHTRPRDPELIQALADAYFEYGYDLRSMLRVLFKSDSFKEARFAKVKSPAEVVVGAMRLIGDYTYPKPGLIDIAMECAYMGQELLNPPTVEGWHTGQEWIDAGTLVERINCVAQKVGDVTKPGVQKIVDRLRSKGFSLSPQDFVDGCLEQLGFVELGTDSRFALEEQIRGGGQLRTGSENFARRVGDLLQLIVASKEYQLS